MKIFSFLKRLNEDLNYNLGFLDFKRLTLARGEKRFFLKWLSDNRFVISLNFSIGTNYTFDIDHTTKSAILVYGTVSERSPNQILVNLQSKNKPGLLAILLVPVFCLFLNLTYNIDIPLLFYIAPPTLYFFISAIFRSEEKRLIQYFKQYMETEQKRATTLYENNA